MSRETRGICGKKADGYRHNPDRTESCKRIRDEDENGEQSL
jgi:hypothetical protein